MRNIVIGRTLDAIFLTLIYFGAYKGNPYAENFIMPLAWLSIVCAVVFAASINDDGLKAKFIKGKKPRSAFRKAYTITYAVVVFTLLCAFGYVVTSVLLALSLALAHRAAELALNELSEPA